MAKVQECAKVDTSSGCQHIIRGETEEEVLRKAAEHAREHGIREVTPELMELVKANMALLFLSRLLLWISASEEEEVVTQDQCKTVTRVLCAQTEKGLSFYQRVALGKLATDIKIGNPAVVGLAGFGMIIVALVFFLPAFSAAQMQGGSGQHMMGSGRGENMGMMGDMQQMMQSGHMTPAQHHQLLGMMHQLASFSGSQKAVSAMT